MQAPWLPSRCEVCHDWADALVCGACRRRFGAARARCVGCAMPLPAASAMRCVHCLREPAPFDAACCTVDYAYPWDRLVAALKYRGRVELAGTLAAMMADALGPDEGAWPDLVIPVPLALERLRERGYNQAWELARRLARALRKPGRADWLRRHGGAAAAATLDRAERARTLRGVFTVAPAATFDGFKVALVDDVLTTGATASEAARTLAHAGAAAVHVWAFARTP